jgi:hypothetical protein
VSVEQANSDAQILDRIAEIVGLDEDGGWCDESGKLESIAYLVRDTGRSVEGFDD